LVVERFLKGLQHIVAKVRFGVKVDRSLQRMTVSFTTPRWFIPANKE